MRDATAYEYNPARNNVSSNNTTRYGSQQRSQKGIYKKVVTKQLNEYVHGVRRVISKLYAEYFHE